MSRSARRILVVDDDPEICELLRLQLVAQGFEVSTVESGEQGILVAAGSPPDLVILDVNMPGMSGFEVLERLRAGERTASTPILMLTAATSSDDIVRGYASGAVYYVPKPHRLDELLRGISLALAEPT